MCLSGAIVAMAPDYPTYMAGRALIGVVVGLIVIAALPVISTGVL